MDARTEQPAPKPKTFKEKVRSAPGAVKEKLTKQLDNAAGMTRETNLPEKEAQSQPFSEQAPQNEKKQELDLAVAAIEDTIETQGELHDTRGQLHHVREEKKRGYDERAERGEMYRVLRHIREQIDYVDDAKKPFWKAKLERATGIFKKHQDNLDELNRQFYDKEHTQHVEVSVNGEKYTIPVLHWQLPGSQESDLPYFYLGGATANETVSRAMGEAYALRGKTVFLASHPEGKGAVVPADFNQKLQETGDLSLYAAIQKEVVRKLFDTQVNLVGTSLGGGVVLEMVTDPDFASKFVHNIDAMSPVGIQETKGQTRITLKFLKEVGKLFSHPTRSLRVGRGQPGAYGGTHEGTGFATSAQVLRKQTLPSERLQDIHINGKIRIALGDSDSVISMKQTKKEIDAANAGRAEDQKIDTYIIQGGNHNSTVVNAPGAVDAMLNPDTLMPGEHTRIFPVQNLPETTAGVLVKNDPELQDIASLIIY